MIVDAQSVKSTDTAEQKGYDGGKQVSRIKRHIAVDSNGLPYDIEVTTANITDRAGALQALARHQDALGNVKNVLADGSCTGEPFAAAVKDLVARRLYVRR